jgi:hypothetical protein
MEQEQKGMNGDTLCTQTACHAFSWLFSWLLTKDYDLTNWGVFLMTVIFVPTVIFWWNARTVQKIPKLMVSFLPPLPDARLSLQAGTGTAHHSVNISFENQTGAIVYVTGPQIRNCSKLFTVPTEAVRDIGENSHPLSFYNDRTQIYEDHQVTLQTGEKRATIIAVDAPMDDTFYRYRPSLIRRWCGRPKYFILEYTAMVDKRKYSVSTKY